MRARVIVGIFLIVIGAVLILIRQFHLSGPWFLYAVGVTFLLLYAASREYGFLIPGCIVTGVAAGIHLQEQATGILGTGLFFLGLGCGFLSIYGIDRLRHPTPVWPLIPGGILTGFGLFFTGRALNWLPPDTLQILGKFWPLILIIIGIYLIFRRR